MRMKTTPAALALLTAGTVLGWLTATAQTSGAAHSERKWCLLLFASQFVGKTN